MNGKTGITADTALDLEQAMQVSADFWIRQEGLYRVYLARMKRDNKG
jgi:plasmid maintenance system antidote protein VapI